MEQSISAWLCPYCNASIRSELASGPHPLTDKRYCTSCGEQIWTKCECGQSLRFDDEYCRNCRKPNPIYKEA